MQLYVCNGRYGETTSDITMKTMIINQKICLKLNFEINRKIERRRSAENNIKLVDVKQK